MKTDQLITIAAAGFVGFLAWRYFAGQTPPVTTASPDGYALSVSPALLTNSAPNYSPAQFVNPVGFSSGSSSSSNPGSTVVFNFGANPTVPATTPAAVMPGTSAAGGSPGTPYSPDGATAGCSCSGSGTQGFGSSGSQALALASIIQASRDLGATNTNGMAYDYGPNSDAERQLTTERRALDYAFASAFR